MSEEVKTVEETKDEVEMTYYKMQMLVGMASDAQRHILIYGLKETLLNKYIDDIIGKSLVKYTANSQVKKRRAFRRNNNQENDDNNISSIIAELNSKIEQACKKLKIEDSSPYKLDQDKYSDRIKNISTLTTSLDKDEFLKIMSKILQLDECYNKKQKWTTTTEDKEKGTETKTTINPPAECENITEEVFIGELYDRISSNKPVEISLDDNGNVTDENKLMDYIIYLSESSENHERRKFKYIIEYINQNIGVIEGLDKDIYGKIMQQLNSKNTLITEYTDDKLSVEEKFYLDNLAKQVVKKIEKDIKAIKQRRLEPVQEAVVEEEKIDPVKEFSKKLDGSWIKPLLNENFIHPVNEESLNDYIRHAIMHSMFSDIDISNLNTFESFEKAIKDKLVEKLEQLGAEQEDIDIIRIYGVKDSTELNNKIKKLEEKQKADKEENEKADLNLKKKFATWAIKQLKEIKDKKIEDIQISDEMKETIDQLPDEIKDEELETVITSVDKISAEIFSKLKEDLNRVSAEINGTNVPDNIANDTVTANILMELLERPTLRQQVIKIRIKYISEKIKELDEYIKNKKREEENTVKFDGEEYNLEIDEKRKKLYDSLLKECKKFELMEKEDKIRVTQLLQNLKNGSISVDEVKELINKVEELKIKDQLPPSPLPEGK